MEEHHPGTVGALRIVVAFASLPTRPRPLTAIDPELADHWRKPPGIFVIAVLDGAVGHQVHEVQRRFDPKLANALPPHVTIVGSSGIGPISADYSAAELRERLAPICEAIAPIDVVLQAPHRFMQTKIVVLPIDPHGPLRVLHEAIATCGLRHSRARFTFSPHVTLSFHRTLTPDTLKDLLAVRIDEPVRISSIRCSLTNEPMPPRTLLELTLGAPER